MQYRWPREWLRVVSSLCDWWLLLRRRPWYLCRFG